MDDHFHHHGPFNVEQQTHLPKGQWQPCDAFLVININWKQTTQIPFTDGGGLRVEVLGVYSPVIGCSRAQQVEVSSVPSTYGPPLAHRLSSLIGPSRLPALWGVLTAVQCFRGWDQSGFNSITSRWSWLHNICWWKHWHFSLKTSFWLCCSTAEVPPVDPLDWWGSAYAVMIILIRCSERRRKGFNTNSLMKCFTLLPRHVLVLRLFQSVRQI